jgi:hypothetical protein
VELDARVDAIGRLRERLPAGTTDAVSLWITMRVLLGLLAAYVVLHGLAPGPCHFELARNGWQTLPPLADQGPAFPMVGVWQRWDACWYTKIATYGYEPSELSVNFWPLFPALTAIVAIPFAGAVALSGLIVSAVAYVAAMIGLFRLVRRDVNGAVALRTMVLITIFPTAFFLFAPFTEATFLALAVWTLLAARERHWAWAFVLGALATLTRIQGIFLTPVIGWEALAAAGLLAWRPWRDVRLPPLDWGPLVQGVVASIGPIVGFLSFIAFSTAVAGQSPLDTQAAWGGKDFHWPWEVAAASWQWVFDHQDPLQLINLASLVLFGVLTVVVIRRLPFSYALYAIPQVLLLATRLQPTPLTSTARYLLVVFPVFVILAMIPSPRLRLAWSTGSALFLGVLTYEFLSGAYIA